MKHDRMFTYMIAGSSQQSLTTAEAELRRIAHAACTVNLPLRGTPGWSPK